MNSALSAFQTALDVTGNNITNVNTIGYSRQSIELNPLPSTLDENHFVGNGVNLVSINRVQSQFLFSQQVQASSEDGRVNTLLSGLNNIQSLTNATNGSSIGDNLTAFFNAWSALGSSPSDPALLQQVQQTGETLASSVQGMYKSLQAQATSTDSQISGTIQQAQTLLTNIAALNKQIQAATTSGSSPNELLDERDQAVQQLSEIMPVKVQPVADGTVMLFSGQMTLVDQTGAATLPTSYDDSTSSLTNGTQSFPITSGQLGGLFQTQQKTASYESQLDTLANTLRTQFNSIESTGTNSLGQTGQNFFQDVPAGQPQTGAVDFQVDPAIVANPQAIATGVSGNASDGGLALSMSNLRSSKVPALGNQTFNDFFTAFVSTIGQDASTAQAQSTTSAAVMQQIGQQISSVSGVSLDQELSNMLQYQRSYQAAAKALSVFDETTNDLINILQ